MISLLLCVIAVVLGTITARGFVTGRATMRYLVAERATNPAGFWFAQLFNMFLAALALFGAVVGVRGI